jgi:hypothetical protein
MDGGEYIKIEKIALCDEKIILVGNQCIGIQPFFNALDGKMNSSQVGIVCGTLSRIRKTYSISSLAEKCFALPVEQNQKFVFVRYLH